MVATAKTAAAGEWMSATHNNVNDEFWYLVKTNGMEWRDHDLYLMRGWEVNRKIRPDYIRGRPILIAQVLMPVPTKVVAA